MTEIKTNFNKRVLKGGDVKTKVLRKRRKTQLQRPWKLCTFSKVNLVIGYYLRQETMFSSTFVCLCACVCLSVSPITHKQYNFARRIDIAQGEIDEILVKVGWKFDAKLAKVCLSLPARVNGMCNY
jgi:hypothetical protein